MLIAARAMVLLVRQVIIMIVIVFEDFQDFVSHDVTHIIVYNCLRARNFRQPDARAYSVFT